MTEHIPMLDLTAEVEALWDDLQHAIAGVLKSGRFILGDEVRAFEQEAAARVGARHAIGVNSGTDALVIGLRALGVEAGDEVITSPFTFFATGEAISIIGAVPVFVDIDAATFNIAPDQVAAAVTPRTRAIVPVHLFGQPADMTPLDELAAAHGLAVLEDAAQAFGATDRGRTAGAIGYAGAFSFFPTKNLATYGDGGMITTSDDGVAELARKLRTHGSLRKYHNETLGYNSRLDELHAAILRVKLAHVDGATAARQRIAARYDAGLAGMPGVTIPARRPNATHVFHQYTIRVAGGCRDELRETLAAAGIASMIYYPVPLHRLPVYSGRAESHPVAERAAGEVLSLPMWPQLPAAAQDRVIDVISAFAGA